MKITDNPKTLPFTALLLLLYADLYNFITVLPTDEGNEVIYQDNTVEKFF